ncbi:hypothetical protein SLEP1_g26744 [Rubroshorea leprosula]|uniref:Uncharacterized protein n=1 Tax=Rubroshorea leprosula TaxID=152421 RepID=A0AAV5JU48_9ROSI|nr:hypothetical protein SLEP1_g26744 [Rubroshorea leprosula]
MWSSEFNFFSDSQNDKAKAEAVRNAEELEASKKEYQMEWSDFSNLFAQGTQLGGEGVAGTGNVRCIQMDGQDFAAKMMEKDNQGIHEKQWLVGTKRDLSIL